MDELSKMASASVAALERMLYALPKKGSADPIDVALAWLDAGQIRAAAMLLNLLSMKLEDERRKSAEMEAALDRFREGAQNWHMLTQACNLDGVDAVTLEYLGGGLFGVRIRLVSGNEIEQVSNDSIADALIKVLEEAGINRSGA